MGNMDKKEILEDFIVVLQKVSSNECEVSALASPLLIESLNKELLLAEKGRDSAFLASNIKSILKNIVT